MSDSKVFTAVAISLPAFSRRVIPWSGILALLLCGCGAPQEPALRTPGGASSAAVRPATPAPIITKLEIQLTSFPRTPPKIALSGPRDLTRTIQKDDGLVQVFELEPGQWTLMVRSEGYQNFKIPISMPGTEKVTVALSPIPKYWEKKQAQEKRAQQQANALKAKKAKEAEQKRKHELAEKRAQEKREQARLAAESASDAEPTRAEYTAALLEAKRMIQESVAKLEWPTDSDPSQVLELLATRLGEEGNANDFAICLGHLRRSTTSSEEEAAQIVFQTTHLLTETSAEQDVTLLRVAKGLCVAAPLENGDGQDLFLISAALVLGMALGNPN